MNDLQEREKERSKKSQSADASRLKGNNYFKRKLYPDALKCYMEALKNQPYDVKILVNIAQVIKAIALFVGLIITMLLSWKTLIRSISN